MSQEFQPYIGPRPFEREDAQKARFFGRHREARELLSRIVAHSAVLLYSQSGAGKTSLINAKLIPLLEEKGFEVLKPGRVRGLRPPDMPRDAIRNIYVFNALRSWDERNSDPKSLADLSLTDFLKQRKRQRNKDGEALPFVAIFDQFEELFTFYTERWGNRQDFFDQIGDALDEDRFMRVVFAMREDYIACLDPYLSALPEKLRTRYRLERLAPDQALRAITGPLENTQYSFADNVAESLVQDLLKVPVETPSGVVKATSEFVEPVQLQVVCQTLWENCEVSWQGLEPSDPRVITLEHLETFGDVDAALSTFYENALKRVVQSTGINEGRLRTWFESVLITPTGTRGTVFRGAEDVGGIPTKVVEELVNQHLVVREIRGGATWVELTHDRLIDPIKTSNEKWRLQYSGGEQTRKVLEERAARWVNSGRDNTLLLDDGEIVEAKRWLESPNATDVGYSFAVLALIQASRAAADEAARIKEQVLFQEQQRRAEAEEGKVEEQQRRIEEQAKSTRRLRWLAAALALMFVFAVASAAWAGHQKQKAITNAKQAEHSAEVARQASQTAEEKTKVAVLAQQQAKRNYDELQSAQELLKRESERARDEARKAKYAARIAKIASEKEKQAKNEYLLISYTLLLKANEWRASSYVNEGETAEAIPIYENLVDAYDSRPFTRDRIRVLNTLAKIYHDKGSATEEERTRELLKKLPIPVGEAMPQFIQQNGIETAIERYKELFNARSNQYYFDEDELNTLGYSFLRKNKTAEAIKIFELNVWSYPDASNTYDSLGEAYMIAGNTRVAIQNYEKSLSLNPKNTNAVEKLKKLRIGIASGHP